MKLHRTDARWPAPSQGNACQHRVAEKDGLYRSYGRVTITVNVNETSCDGRDWDAAMVGMDGGQAGRTGGRQPELRKSLMP